MDFLSGVKSSLEIHETYKKYAEEANATAVEVMGAALALEVPNAKENLDSYKRVVEALKSARAAWSQCVEAPSPKNIFLKNEINIQLSWNDYIIHAQHQIAYWDLQVSRFEAEVCGCRATKARADKKIKYRQETGMAAENAWINAINHYKKFILTEYISEKVENDCVKGLLRGEQQLRRFHAWGKGIAGVTDMLGISSLVSSTPTPTATKIPPVDLKTLVEPKRPNLFVSILYDSNVNNNEFVLRITKNNHNRAQRGLLMAQFNSECQAKVLIIDENYRKNSSKYIENAYKIMSTAVDVWELASTATVHGYDHLSDIYAHIATLCEQFSKKCVAETKPVLNNDFTEEILWNDCFEAVNRLILTVISHTKTAAEYEIQGNLKLSSLYRLLSEQEVNIISCTLLLHNENVRDNEEERVLYEGIKFNAEQCHRSLLSVHKTLTAEPNTAEEATILACYELIDCYAAMGVAKVNSAQDSEYLRYWQVLIDKTTNHFALQLDLENAFFNRQETNEKIAANREAITAALDAVRMRELMLCTKKYEALNPIKPDNKNADTASELFSFAGLRYSEAAAQLSFVSASKQNVGRNYRLSAQKMKKAAQLLFLGQAKTTWTITGGNQNIHVLESNEYYQKALNPDPNSDCSSDRTSEKLSGKSASAGKSGKSRSKVEKSYHSVSKRDETLYESIDYDLNPSLVVNRNTSAGAIGEGLDGYDELDQLAKDIADMKEIVADKADLPANWYLNSPADYQATPSEMEYEWVPAVSSGVKIEQNTSNTNNSATAIEGVENGKVSLVNTLPSATFTSFSPANNASGNHSTVQQQQHPVQDLNEVIKANIFAFFAQKKN